MLSFIALTGVALVAIVKCIPTQFVKKRYAINHRNMDLRSKFHLCLGFPANNWPDMWLMNAHNTILNTMGTRVIHLLLLIIQSVDHHQVFEILWCQGHCRMIIQKFFNRTQITLEKPKLTTLISQINKMNCRVGRGISAPASHRTVLDSLPSYGSS